MTTPQHEIEIAKAKLLNEKARQLKLENDQRELKLKKDSLVIVQAGDVKFIYSDLIKCPVCDGWGKRWIPNEAVADGQYYREYICPACNGDCIIRLDQFAKSRVNDER